MRHRLVSGTCMGNPSNAILNNKGKLNKKFSDFVFDAYFLKHQYFDFHVSKDMVAVGVEPAYQYEEMFIIRIDRDKGESYILRGKAWGPYGTQVVMRKKFYKDYKNKCKFVRMVDQFDGELFK